MPVYLFITSQFTFTNYRLFKKVRYLQLLTRLYSDDMCGRKFDRYIIMCYHHGAVKREESPYQSFSVKIFQDEKRVISPAAATAIFDYDKIISLQIKTRLNIADEGRRGVGTASLDVFYNYCTYWNLFHNHILLFSSKKEKLIY